MDQTSPAKNLTRHYERIYDVEKDFRNYNLSILVAFLARGKKVLDLGCGSGFLLDFLSQRGFRAIGLEPNNELIVLAKRRNQDLDIKKGEAEDIDSLVLEKVDTVFAVDVIEHIKDDVSIFKKIYRHLHSGGRLVVVVPAYPWLYGRRDEKYGHFRRYSKSKLGELLAKEGFSIKFSRYWNALGLLPYVFYEKILRRELETGWREEKSGVVKKIVKKLFHLWFHLVENSVNFGFGLSIVVVAEKN